MNDEKCCLCTASDRKTSHLGYRTACEVLADVSQMREGTLTVAAIRSRLEPDGIVTSRDP